MGNQLRNYSKQFGFTPVYSFELIQGLEEAVKHDEKLIKQHKELQKDLEEKGTVEKATVEELVFTPIGASPHSFGKENIFDNKYYYNKNLGAGNRKSKDYPNFKYLWKIKLSIFNYNATTALLFKVFAIVFWWKVFHGIYFIKVGKTIAET